MSSAETSLPETLKVIFNSFQVEPFTLRRQPHAKDDSSVCKAETRESKRPKREAAKALDQLLTPDAILHIQSFLDPFELLQWLGTCKAAAGGARPLTLKLDAVLQTFRIVRATADKAHQRLRDTRPDWSWVDVLHVLLQALHELQKVYGPYTIHSLHAAIVGESLMRAFCHDGDDWLPKEEEQSKLRYLWNFRAPETNICGNLGDYFAEEETLEEFLEAAVANAEEVVSAGPGRVLAKEGRMPFINVFCFEAEEHTRQFGFSFQKMEGNKMPYVFFSMDYQELPEEGDSLDGLYYWYNGRPRSDDTNMEALNYGTSPFLFECGFGEKGDEISIEQVFCQFALRPGASWRVADAWTQALRATWLQARNIPPFDQRTDQGKEAWEHARHAILAVISDDAGKQAENLEGFDLCDEQRWGLHSFDSLDEAKAHLAQCVSGCYPGAAEAAHYTSKPL